MAKKRGKAKKKAGKKTKRHGPYAKEARAAQAENPKSQQKNRARLTPKQTLFVDCYLGAARRCGTKAAVMAGYSEKTATAQATALLANHFVKAYLRKRQDDLARRVEVTQEKIVREMAVLAFSKPTDYLRWRNGRLLLTDSDEIPDCLAGAIKGLKPIFDRDGNSLGIEVSFYDKVAAAKLLAQHLGMLDLQVRDGSKGTIVEFMERLMGQAKAEEGNK